MELLYLLYNNEREWLSQLKQLNQRGKTMANITIKNINSAVATNSHNMEFKKIRNMAIKIANSGKRVSFDGFDNFYQININNNICRRANLTNREVKEYVRICDILGAMVKNIRITGSWETGTKLSWVR